MTNPKTKPILFSGPMVRAILDVRKTQTRRIIKNATVERDGRIRFGNKYSAIIYDSEQSFLARACESEYCPYKVGDRLWVRETFLAVGGMNPDRARIVYRATNDGPDQWISPCWKPSIHMPRWASRITLEITDVRCQRLQDISEYDAQADGCPEQWHGLDKVDIWFHDLWNSINGPDAWDANPWVWALTFKVVD